VPLEELARDPRFREMWRTGTVRGDLPGDSGERMDLVVLFQREA
jgi:hypothetical protein